MARLVPAAPSPAGPPAPDKGPFDIDLVFRLLRGVGLKIAALTLGVGFRRPAISVDIDVRRIVNRSGYVAASTPDRTMQALLVRLPERHWVEINERLVPFGKFVCTGPPRCSGCVLLRQCRQVGVTAQR